MSRGSSGQNHELFQAELRIGQNSQDKRAAAKYVIPPAF